MGSQEGVLRRYLGSVIESRSLPPGDTPSSQIPLRDLFSPPNNAELAHCTGIRYALYKELKHCTQSRQTQDRMPRAHTQAEAKGTGMQTGHLPWRGDYT